MFLLRIIPFLLLFSFIISPRVFTGASDNSLRHVVQEEMSTGRYVGPSVQYPPGEDFDQLEKIIETTFSSNSSQEYDYRNTCIAENTLCPNYRYTSLTEKAIKLIVIKTYKGNETFYETLFHSRYPYYDSTVSNKLTGILNTIPRGNSISPFTANLFSSSSISDDLLSASFGLDLDEANSSSDMIRSIEGVIERLKREKCQKVESTNDEFYNCYNYVPNKYLPTEEELFAETIFLNGKSIQIGDLSGEIVYQLPPYTGSVTIPPYPYESSVNFAYSGFLNDQTLTQRFRSSEINDIKQNFELLQSFRMNPNETDLERISGLYLGEREASTELYRAIEDEVRYYSTMFAKREPIYPLRFRNATFSIDEAEKKLSELRIQNAPLYYTSLQSWRGVAALPCTFSTSFQIHTECQILRTDAKTIINALTLIERSHGVFPERLEELMSGDVNLSPDILDRFRKNFSYKKVSDGYEITYIGQIGEESGSGGLGKDYRAMMSGAIVTPPEIFSRVPNDTAFFYLRSPQALFDILKMKSDTTMRLTGTDVSQSIQSLIARFFEMEDISRLEKHLTHEAMIVMMNLDLMTPDIVLILSDADRGALSLSGKTLKFSSQSGYIYVANSQSTLDRFLKLDIHDSMMESPDLQYVWWKKGSSVQDAFLFVGDRFFEKALSLEGYISLYRKYHDYRNLWSLQELVWAYYEAFGKSPASLAEFEDILSEEENRGNLSQSGNFTLTGDTVIHNNLGTVYDRGILSDAYKTITNVQNSELLSYRENIEGYRDIWQANLDPLGIVLNRYGDGFEIDFFMTPIPAGVSEFVEFRRFLEGNTKSTLNFITNSRLRSGILSFVVGVDVEKLMQALMTDPDIIPGLVAFNKEELGGKNIFDFLGGEVALTFGAIDPDMFEGWNIEKLDANLLIEFQSEEKGKEFLDIVRQKFLDSFGTKSTYSKLLVKPLIEDYKGKKIYYIESIPLLFTRINFAYTFIDNFCVIGVNRTSVKNAIDGIADNKKGDVLDVTSFQSGSFFATLFHGKAFALELAQLYKSEGTLITTSLTRAFPDIPRFLNPIKSYYKNYILSLKLATPDPSFSRRFGFATIRGNSGNVFLHLDSAMAKNFSGATLSFWQDVESKLASEIFTERGVLLEKIDSLTYQALLKVILASHLDGVLGEDPEKLLQNITFGMSMGNDEIGFKVRVFRDQHLLSHALPTVTTNPYLILLGFSFFLLLGAGAYILSRSGKMKEEDGERKSIPDGYREINK